MMTLRIHYKGPDMRLFNITGERITKAIMPEERERRKG